MTKARREIRDLGAQADRAEREAAAALERLERDHDACACPNGCGCAGRTRTARQALRAVAASVREEERP